jgi:NAD(P)-dependent dehydrogenase (short-subunit alcohol dehydrogenase family)
MGAARARMFAREGAKVVIADLLEHEGRQVAEGIGASARFESLDVTKEESWAAVVSATTRHSGKLDVLVNNAGVSGSAEQDFYSTEAWHRIIAVNATGVFFGIKYAILRRLGTKSSQTLRWREVDSNFRFRDALSSPTACPWSRRLIRREWRLLE